MKSLFAAAILTALGSAPALAAICTSHAPLPGLSAPGAAAIGGSFSSAGNYKDCYTFTLATESDLGGFSQEVNLMFNRRFVNVAQVSLYWGGVVGDSTAGALLDEDATPGLFSFNKLASGTYTLLVNTLVGSHEGFFRTAVGYVGAFATRPSEGAPQGGNVPEPGTVALVLAGLLAAACRTQRT